MLAHHLVSSYMTRALERAALDTALAEVERRLAAHHISALPVVDERDVLAGVVSRFDLIHHARQRPDHPDATCADVMTRQPITVAPGASLGEAATRMLEHRIHRVFVVDGERLVGVLTTTDLVRAASESTLTGTVDTIMSAPVVTVGVELPLAQAVEQLDRDHVSGLVVTENDWPVGVFAQEDALAAAGQPPSTPLGSVFDPSLVCVPRETAITSAAALAVRTGVRRIVVSHQRDFVGVVTGLDFARAVARA